jgi:hypothetical protein
MNPKWPILCLPGVCLTLATSPVALAGETNSPATSTQAVITPSLRKPDVEEKRAYVEAWRQQRGWTNQGKRSYSFETNKNLSLEERRALIRARLAELHGTARVRTNHTTTHTNKLNPK